MPASAGSTRETRYAVKDVSAALGGLPVKMTTIYYKDIAISVLEAMRDGKRVLLAFKRERRRGRHRATPMRPRA